MEALIPLVILVVLAVPAALTIWLIVRAVSARNRIEELSRRVGGLELEVHQLKTRPVKTVPTTAEAAPPETAAQKVAQKISPIVAEPVWTAPPIVSQSEPVIPAPPPIPEAAPLPETVELPPISKPEETTAVPPPFTPPPRFEPAPSFSNPAPSISWEQFMGVKLFAWIGGLALFLGVVFFVKYSFEHNLISPELRVAIGFITGLALLIGGVVLH